MKNTILIPVALGLSACGGGGGGSSNGEMDPAAPPAVAFASSGYAKTGDNLPSGANGKTFNVIGLTETDGLDQNGDGKLDGNDAQITIAFSDTGDTAVVTIDGQSYTLAKEVTIDNLGANFPPDTEPKVYLLDDGVTDAEVTNIISRTYNETTSNGNLSFTFFESSNDYFGQLDLSNDTHGNVLAFYGFTTDPAELKALGTATYTVALGLEIGDGTQSATNYSASGQGSLSANFADGEISGTVVTEAIRTIDEDLANPSTIDVTVSLDGDITGNTFSTGVTLDQNIAHIASDLSADGIFFGPDGVELGGAIVGTIDTTAGGNKDVGGVLFGAKD